MFFVLSKILTFLIAPLNWIIGLLLYGLFARNARRKRWALTAGVVLLVLLTNPLLINLVSRAWEPDPPVLAEIIKPYEVGIVLGGFLTTYFNYRDRIHLSQDPNRLIHALELYRSGKIKKIVITGGSSKVIGDKYTGNELLEEFLIGSGIRKEDFMVEGESRNTRENAVNTAALLAEKMPGARCLLITSGFHMRRALGTFRKVGIDVSPMPTDLWGDDIEYPTPETLLFPSTSGLKKWTRLVREWVGIAVYRVQGYF